MRVSGERARGGHRVPRLLLGHLAWSPYPDKAGTIKQVGGLPPLSDGGSKRHGFVLIGGWFRGWRQLNGHPISHCAILC